MTTICYTSDKCHIDAISPFSHMQMNLAYAFHHGGTLTHSHSSGAQRSELVRVLLSKTSPMNNNKMFASESWTQSYGHEWRMEPLKCHLVFYRAITVVANKPRNGLSCCSSRGTLLPTLWPETSGANLYLDIMKTHVAFLFFFVFLSW